MKNTETSTGERIKAEAIRQKILWRINLLERQIFECKKGFTCFYAQVQKKSIVSAGEKNENSVSWIEAFDDFMETWEEMEKVKDEMDWMIRDIFFAVEREEEEEYKKKIKNNKKGHNKFNKRTRD